MREWTEQQQKAIFALDNQILVSAAAGSGKTAVLVERILELVCSSVIDIDQILVVTFTDAAAGEMSHRLNQALGERIAQNPTDHNLRRQLMLLGRANISTIHSFCLRVIKASFHLLDIDPGAKIADKIEIQLLKDQVINNLFEQWYQKTGVELLFFHNLVEMYGSKYSDDGLKNTVLEVYTFALGDPDPVQWLKNHSSSFDKKDIKQTPWYDLVVNYAKSVLQEVSFACEKAIELCNGPKGPKKYAQAIEDDYITVTSALTGLENHNWQGVLSVLETPSSRFLAVSKKDDVDPDLKDLVSDIRKNEIKAKLADLQKNIFFKPIEEMGRDLNELHPTIDTLVKLVIDFHENFSSAKRQKNIMDFNDLEHFAIAALKHKEICDNFNFHQVLIDEYQDSNYIQEFILNSVGDSCFMVGDIKQSIYKFRGAVPELFLGKMKKEVGDIRLIPLSKNFRSGKNVIDTVNFLFERLLPQTGIVYDQNAKLNQGSNTTSAPTQVHIINKKEDNEDFADNQNVQLDTEMTNMELEALAVAKKIKQLVADGVAYGDIAILTRTVTGVSDILVDTLSTCSIPAYGESSAGFFETTEIMTLISLLNVIDNPLQDIHVIAVLKSGLYSIDVNDMVQKRQESSGYFFDCLEGSQFDKFFSDLEYFRDIARYKSVEQLLIEILHKTQFHHYIEQTKGEMARANIHMLIEIAQRRQGSLYHFVAYIERLTRQNIALGEAKKTAGSQNAVAIISIHKSKGLEYPIVFVVGMGRRFNIRDRQKDLMLHRHYGFGPKYIDLVQRVKYPTLASVAISKAIHAESIAEEMRILYVAATRACTQLILIGCADSSQKKWLRPYSYLSAITFFDMIMPSLMDSTAENLPFEFFEHTPEQLLEPIEEAQSVAKPQEIPIYHQPIKKHAPTLPTSINIAQIKGNYYKQMSYYTADSQTEPQQTLDSPAFLKKSKQILTAQDIGNIHHTVMEYISPNSNINDLLTLLLQKNLLTDQEASAVNIHWIKSFLDSPLAKRMAKAQYIKKETHFAMNITASEAYLDTDLPADRYNIVTHGIIDAYFEESNKLILVDYKTDSVKTNIDTTIKKRYKMQMDIYKKALENMTQKTVAQTIIYLLPTSKEIIV